MARDVLTRSFFRYQDVKCTLGDRKRRARNALCLWRRGQVPAH